MQEPDGHVAALHEGAAIERDQPFGVDLVLVLRRSEERPRRLLHSLQQFMIDDAARAKPQRHRCKPLLLRNSSVQATVPSRNARAMRS